MKELYYCLCLFKDGHAELKRKAKIEGDTTIMAVVTDKKDKLREFTNHKVTVPGVERHFWVLVEKSTP